VILININTLLEIADIFRFRWDAATLACLEQPIRFRALARELTTRLGDRVEDNALSRSLNRLRRTGLVTAHHTQAGRRLVPLYQLTDKGRQRRAHQALVLIYRATAITGHSNGRNGGNGTTQPGRMQQ
jgi:DNA-binding HxlR family transcriptional regulator